MNYPSIKVCIVCKKKFETYQPVTQICSTKCKALRNREYARISMLRKHRTRKAKPGTPCTFCKFSLDTVEYYEYHVTAILCPNHLSMVFHKKLSIRSSKDPSKLRNIR